MSKHKIINNFIDPVLFSDIKNTVNGDTFYWFYNDYINWRPSNHFQFKNQIIKDSKLTSYNFVNYFKMCQPMLDKIFLKKIHSLSFHLLPNKPETIEYELTRYKLNSKIAILFSDNSDGGIIIDNQFLKCTENQLIKFNTNNNLKFVFPIKEKITTFVLLNYN
tara:strand:- start:631 stop:1119 length:489 start_codon:yes stop_codon:yes gene_type:complete